MVHVIILNGSIETKNYRLTCVWKGNAAGYSDAVHLLIAPPNKHLTSFSYQISCQRKEKSFVEFFFSPQICGIPNTAANSSIRDNRAVLAPLEVSDM